ncbi:MAG: hypothetical protein K8E66_04530, partial [Phycisphaerales bacterium]|nr:hypothetical protein [Phycisphaerales bacterium]
RTLGCMMADEQHGDDADYAIVVKAESDSTEQPVGVPGNLGACRRIVVDPEAGMAGVRETLVNAIGVRENSR